MTRITITALSDKGRERIPNMLNFIAPHETEGDKSYIFVAAHGFHSEEARISQVAFLFVRFAEGFLKEGVDFSWQTEPWENK